MLLSSRSGGFEELKSCDVSKNPKEMQILMMDNSCTPAENLLLMVELRKKILKFRDIIDLPPCDDHRPISELVIGTLEDFHKLYPKVVPSPSTSQLDGTSTNQVLNNLYSALTCIGDSWIENHKWLSKFKYDKEGDMKRSSFAQLGDRVLAKLDYMIMMAREMFEVMDEDGNKSDQRNSTFGYTLNESYSNIKAYCRSPVTPVSVLPELVQCFADVSYSPPLLWPLRLQAVGKLKSTDMERLSSNMFPVASRGSSPDIEWKAGNEVESEDKRAKSTSQDLKLTKNSAGPKDKTASEIAAPITPKAPRLPPLTPEAKPRALHPQQSSCKESQKVLQKMLKVYAGRPPEQPKPSLLDMLPPEESVDNASTLVPKASAEPSPSPQTSSVPTNASLPPTSPPPPPIVPLSASLSPSQPPVPMLQPNSSTSLPPLFQSNISIKLPSPFQSTMQRNVSTAPQPPPLVIETQVSISSYPPPRPMQQPDASKAPPRPTSLNGSAPPPPPPGAGKALRPKKTNTKLKRSSHMGNLYRVLRGKVEGSNQDNDSIKSSGRKNIGGVTGGSKQSMADALAEMTKRSVDFQQIEEDVEKHAKTIQEIKTAINSFKTNDMDQLHKFHQHVESQLEKLTDETQVLARFEDFPTKKLETLRTATALHSKLDAMKTTLTTWKIEPPLAEQLDKVENYFNKIKGEVDTMDRTKDEDSKRFQSHNIGFDFLVLVRIKEAMVDLSSSCMEFALKDRREAKAASDRVIGSNTEKRLKACTKVLWRAFQLAFRVYTFAGGHDDRADMLSRELAQEIENAPDQ